MPTKWALRTTIIRESVIENFLAARNWSQLQGTIRRSGPKSHPRTISQRSRAVDVNTFSQRKKNSGQFAGDCLTNIAPVISNPKTPLWGPKEGEVRMRVAFLG